MSDTLTVNIGRIPALLERVLLDNLRNPSEQTVLYLAGQPGIGKTEAVKQAHKRIAERFANDATLREAYGDTYALNATTRAVHMESFDVRGAPDIKGGKTVWRAPDWWPTSGAGLFFIDEFGQAYPATQAAFAQPIHDRTIGDVRIAAGWSFVAAGNRESDRAGSHALLTHVADRMVIIDCVADFEGFQRIANERGFSPYVLAFLRYRPEHFCPRFDPKSRINATPRSWEFVSRVMRAGHDQRDRMAMVSGLVGEGIATEYESFMEQMERLVPIDVILSKPDTAPVPLDEPSALYAIGAGIARHATDETIENALIYIQRMPREFQVFTVRDITQQNDSLLETPAIISWIADNADITL